MCQPLTLYSYSLYAKIITNSELGQIWSALSGGTEENYKKPQTRQMVLRPRLEPCSSRMEIKRVTGVPRLSKVTQIFIYLKEKWGNREKLQSERMHQALEI
jgi:hypothetical protein